MPRSGCAAGGRGLARIDREPRLEETQQGPYLDAAYQYQP